MNNVYVIGVGMMRFGKYLDGSVRAMAGRALDLVLADAGLQTDDIQVAHVSNSFWVDIGERLSRKAYEAAGMGPDNIDLAELHDATAYGELHQCEAMGFCPAGQGGILTESGATTLGGSIPVNTSGGLEWPYDHVGAVITMGYPAVQIDRPVPREFPRVLWVEQES